MLPAGIAPMPGMSGETVLERIRERFPDPWIIVRGNSGFVRDPIPSRGAWRASSRRLDELPDAGKGAEKFQVFG